MSCAMNQDQAIKCADAVIRTHPMVALIDLNRATARYVNGASAIREAREKFPHMDLNLNFEDYWMVSFPLLKEDEVQRSALRVTVNPATGVAEIVEDL